MLRGISVQTGCRVAGCCAGRVGLPERSQEPDPWFGVERRSSCGSHRLLEAVPFMISCGSSAFPASLAKHKKQKAPGAAEPELSLSKEPGPLGAPGGWPRHRHLPSPAHPVLGFYGSLWAVRAWLTPMKYFFQSFRCFSVRVS